jgi:hypothetical protein
MRKMKINNISNISVTVLKRLGSLHPELFSDGHTIHSTGVTLFVFFFTIIYITLCYTYLNNSLFTRVRFLLLNLSAIYTHKISSRRNVFNVWLTQIFRTQCIGIFIVHTYKISNS